MITQVAFGCGPGSTMVNGVCVAKATDEPSAGVCDGKEALALSTGVPNRNWRPMDQIGRQFPFSSAAYEATKRALVLIALVFVLRSTKVYGPGHQTKNIYREKAQPLFLLGCEGCGKRLPCVGKLLELSCPLSQCVGAVTHNIDGVTVSLIALPR